VTRRSKICFALPSLAGGGAERAAVQILNGLDESRWEKWLYLFRRTGPYLADVASSVRISEGPGDSRLRRWLALRAHIRAVRPDLVVSFLSYFTVITAVRASGTGARVAFNQQTPMSAFLGDGDYPWRGTWHRRFFSAATRLGYSAADLVVTTSAGVAEDLVTSFGVGRDRIKVVHNPVDLVGLARAAEAPLEPSHTALWNSPVIVAAGRLAEAKNYPLLIESLAIVRKRLPARLFILGQGDQEARLRDLAAARGVADAVVFCGFQTNPWRYIARADVFVLTSRYEGFGNVLIEAMACGTPVVATSSPGTREIIQDGRNGLLVEQHEPRAVAEALERLLASEALRTELSIAARTDVQRFAAPSIAAEYDRVFERALA
jgi:glycosyltransferase involved in cell wall biosynthesis